MSKLRTVFETIMGVLVISVLVILMMAAIAAVINSVRIKQFDNYIIYQHEVYRKTELTEEVIKQIIDK